ncbi:WbqC family protein [Cohnella sp. WQ 127256]|uniref:WbqC family protein n=1 Tax=Cohnella sp. WQ 127256 TaxID=2938790 RepID=UPI002118D34B|nr:WbqC family protein [Cohnella sp. WQ 127256]
MFKKLCIYQPNVFPPLHYFNRIMNSDVWVMLDDVQLNKKVGQTRFSLKVNGQEHKIAIPILGGNRVKINEAVIPYHHWIDKLHKTLDYAYGNCPFFETARSSAIDYVEHHQRLNTNFKLFCEHFTIDMLRKLGWQGEVVSSKGLAEDLKASERMAEIAYQLEGTHYVCGNEGFQQYVDLTHFQNRKLAIIVQLWKCPEYPQSKGSFLHNLSILDLIANVGLDRAREILVSGDTMGWKVYE